MQTNDTVARDKPLRLLIVEDSHDDAALILHYLDEHGIDARAEIVASESGFYEALEQHWDIILCDYSLPAFSPRRAIEILRQIQSPIPLLIISGDLDPAHAARLMLSGARDFIDKNDLSRLIPAITRELHVVRLQTEKQEIEKHIAHLANFDESTSLPNYNYFNSTLTELFNPDSKQVYVISHINLNRLSMINDVHGSEVSNAIIRETAARMHRLGENSLFARLDSNDFAYLPDSKQECYSCDSISDRIYQVFNEPFIIDNREHFLTPTIGVSCYPCHGESAEKILRNAKYAMHHAQRQQLPIQHYTEEIEKENIERELISDRLRGAVKHNEFTLHYQPKLNTKEDRITALEVLIRWTDSQLGSVPPARFIPIAEETGDIMAIGEWVLYESCRQAKQWRDSGIFSGTIAVNISMRQLRDPDFALRVQSVLTETGLPASALELEITETDIMQDSELSIAILEKLRKLGVTLVIDDFGTGYSSLSYLKRLPISTLKIDRAFISDIETSQDSLAIIQAIMALAKSLKLSVVAEGVETQKQLSLLCRHECDEIQGYHISRPLDRDAISRFIEAYNEKNAVNLSRI